MYSRAYSVSLTHKKKKNSLLAQYYTSSIKIMYLKKAKTKSTYTQSTSPLYLVRGIHMSLWLFVKVSVVGLGFQLY